jgi:hypothetical protein
MKEGQVFSARKRRLSFSVSLCVTVELTDKRGGGGAGEGAKSYDGKKASSSIIY